MTYSTKLVFSHEDSLLVGGKSASKTRKEAFRAVLSELEAYVSGARVGHDFTLLPNVSGCGAQAAGVVDLDTSSGTVGVTVNGVALTATWATSDQASADALAALVNASTNARIQYQYAAGKAARASVALSSFPAGSSVYLFGFRFQAKASAALCVNAGDFDMSGSNSADATALAAAINAMPVLCRYVVAVASSATVYVYPKWTTSAVPSALKETTCRSDSTAATVTQMAADPSYAVYALEPGALGNCTTFAVTGTGVTALLAETVNSVVRMTGGTGGPSSARLASRF